VSLTFNSGLESQFTNARPLLLSHRMNATFYLSSGLIDRGYACCMSWWQVDELYQDGDEIGGMGVDHKDLTQIYKSGTEDYAFKKTQVCDDRRRLIQRGYHPESFAYPRGSYSFVFAGAAGDVERLISLCGYQSARAVGGLSPGGPVFSEPFPPRDPLAMHTPTATSDGPVDIASLEAAVSAAARHGGGLVPVVFNEVCHAGAPNYARCMATSRPIEDTTLARFLDWLSAAGRPDGAPAGTLVRTIRQALGFLPPPKLPARPTIVSLTFDDADASQYLMLPLLRDHSMAATFYVPTGRKKMSWSELHNLASAGNEIGGHTVYHIDLTSTAIPDAVKLRNICDDRQELIRNGFRALSFAYPFGAYNAAVEQLVKSCGYLSARATGGLSPRGDPSYAQSFAPKDPYALRTVTLSDGPVRLSELEASVNATARHGGGWLVFVFHQLCSPKSPDYQTCMRSFKPAQISTLAAFLDWLEFNAPPGTVVDTVSQALGTG
jgi:peptidoglycan/xylan/chitin deacetylase (PgdA/CDA1 family)